MYELLSVNAFCTFPGYPCPTAPVALDAVTAAAVMNAWEPTLKRKSEVLLTPPGVLNEDVYCNTNTVYCLILANNFLNFATAARKYLLPDIDCSDHRGDSAERANFACFADIVLYFAKRAGFYWEMAFKNAETGKDGSETALATSDHFKAYMSGRYSGRIKQYFDHEGLDWCAVQQKFASSVPAGRGSQLYWDIFLSGVVRALRNKEPEYKHNQRHPYMLTRFTFFSALLRDSSSDLRSDARKRIRDPVTLGGAFGVHAPYRGEMDDAEERTTLFMKDIITIIWCALEKLPQLSVEGLSVPSERRAEQAVATYLGMPRL